MPEFEYIDWLRKQTPRDPRVIVGPGDDCAVLGAPVADAPGSPPNAPGSPQALSWLVTTDMLMDGTDFVLGQVEPRRIGRKAIAVNLSDIAAMAGLPVAAFVSVALPRKGGRSLAEQLYLGMREIADEFNVALAGGDTNSWDGPLVISVTLLGTPTPPGPVLRRGARPGDRLFVTESLGGSILGKHLDFTPRVREALALQKATALHAMIDISDGLAADVYHLVQESGCGCVLRADAIPISAAARLMNDDKPPLEHALSDGEDFELAFAVSPEDGRRLLENQSIARATLFYIGDFVGEKGLWLEEGQGRRPLPPRGWVHDL